MGFGKQFKDMKKMTSAAPGMIEQAQIMQQQAQEMAAANQAAAVAQQQQAGAANAAAAAAGGPDWEPIAGVSLELYAEISKGLAAYNYDQSKAVDIAAEKGVNATSWQQAMDGWNARMKTNPAIGQRFNALYTGRA